MTFGRKVRELRTLKGLSINALRKSVGISLTYLTNIEKGRTPPPSATIVERLAKALDVPVSELLIYAKDKIPKVVVDSFNQNKVSMEKVPELLGILRERNLNRQSWDKIIRTVKMIL